jgi:hypothetical protein
MSHMWNVAHVLVPFFVFLWVVFDVFLGFVQMCKFVSAVFITSNSDDGHNWTETLR